MKKMFLLFSHQLTQEQKKDAQLHYGVKKFVALPRKLQKLWSAISPDSISIVQSLQELKLFLKQEANKGDIALIQGDFGAVYHMVNFCKSKEIVSIYATTKRNTKEYIEEGKMVKKSVFEFRRFREYE